MAAKRPRAAEIAWVVKQLEESGCEMTLEIATLTEEPTLERFWQMVPELDYELPGSTWESPAWAYERHPWYTYLGITEEECDAFWEAATARSPGLRRG